MSITTTAEEAVLLLLDISYSSPLLRSKISDIPAKHKIKLITFPLLESQFETGYSEKIDIVRDKTFIIQQLSDYLDLGYHSFLEVIPGIFNLWEDVSFASAFFGRTEDIIDFQYFAKNKDFLLDHPNLLQFADSDLLQDTEFMKKAIERNGLAIKYAPEEFRNDREMVLNAVKSVGYALKYVSQIFKQDREIVLAVANSTGLAIKFASDQFKKDREIALCAVEQDGLVLRFFDSEFSNDREIVLKAVSNNGNAIEYASEDLKKDREIFFTALKSCDVNVFHKLVRELDGKLLFDKELVLNIVKLNGAFLCSFNNYWDDKEVVLEALKTHDYTQISDSLMDDTDIILALLKYDYEAIFEGDSVEHLNSNRDFMLSAVKVEPLSFKYASDDLKKDKFIIKEAIRSEAALFKQYTPAKLYSYVGGYLGCDHTLYGMECIEWDEELLDFAYQEYDYVSFLLDISHNEN